jgi:magnesium/cobalt transport protein CorA
MLFPGRSTAGRGLQWDGKGVYSLFLDSNDNKQHRLAQGMDIIYIPESGAPERHESIEHLPSQGFAWLDIERESSVDWAQLITRLTGVTLHEGHVRDSLNTLHPSFYDGTSEYDMIIFRSLAPDSDLNQLASHATAFFLLEHLLVTVRPADSRSIPEVKKRLLNRQGRVSRRTLELMHHIMNAMVDRFLAMREPLSIQLERWRKDLLDPHHLQRDWMALMDYQIQLRRLSLLCEGQEDAIQQWREETGVEIDEHMSIRFNDLNEHIGRVMRFASEQQQDIEALVQLHFSAVAHRTNDIVRVLTVVSVIFLPLTLVAGIFGMNFQYMPELSYHYGYFMVLGGMGLLAVILLLIFRIKRWI